MEILAPLGKIEYLNEIVEAGADAVYAGISGLSSRPRSADLTLDEFKWAIQYCHNSGKKIYVAFNACISDKNIDEILKYAQILDTYGVDAIIAADYGLVAVLANKLKYSKIHASTLLGVYNSQSIKILDNLGVNRIILSSDLYLSEISELIRKNSDMEYEIIAAGGICFQCNRQCRLTHGMSDGEYKVACQNPYVLLENGKMIGRAKGIGAPQIRLYATLGLYQAIGISSFKIEGRTNKLKDVCQRIQELVAAEEFLKNRENETAGYLHYISRYLEGENSDLRRFNEL